ncbi:prepilin-type N-terminal cleavage/methylation domain-containing protein [Planctomycetota bacterium]
MGRICDPIEKRTQRLGFTLVEAVVSMLIVSVMFVAALSTVGASRLSQFKTSRASRGQALAESLMAEILRQDYLDPNGTPVFGPESGEAGATRAAFDDVDDYHGWSSSPPTNRDGTAISAMEGWQRSVTVEWVDPMDVTQVQGSETNAKRVTVTVSVDNMPVATLVAIRTNWEL